MNKYITPPEFKNLYSDFTGHAHPDYPEGKISIAQELARSLAAESQATEMPGPLVIATATGIYAYDAKPGHPLICGTSFRATENTGFYEVTAISHLGPAIAYLATLKELHNNNWQLLAKTLLDHVISVRAVNNVPLAEHWLSQLQCQAWVGKEIQIKNMIDYACSLAGNYLVKILKNPQEFNSEQLMTEFLTASTQSFPIGFNTIMIGTFAIVALKSAYDIFATFNQAAIDWKNAKVILHNQAGTNYSAGLTAGSNWLHPTLLAIAQHKIASERIIIPPYALLPATIGNTFLSADEFNYCANQIWGALYARPEMTKRAFKNVPDIKVPDRSAIPGDYPFTQADQIDHFIMRLKFSTANIKEMQSNTIGFWIAGEAHAKNWDLAKIAIPGLTHGLPEAIKHYPAASPAIGEY